ncbi:trypsin-like serine protease [Amycolatopsis sp., V23-08]|uniref:Trypsin-like serine protease n=1 Tax=Amycolatopsis heterodermiae TaxID=3110235 RepID=A0ABU5RLN7_9PSEU|nr:trypsin-like serine protease [Amycolatopsis sp., V23-08]MEA5367202.1 trypsin-like serine protease [Amycolatopsis sp., V23-08]
MSTSTAVDTDGPAPFDPVRTANQLAKQIDELTAQRDAAREAAYAAAKQVLAGLPMTPQVAPAPAAAPWMVAMRWDCPARGFHDKAGGVGVLIGDRHVLTAAHHFDATLPVPPELENDPTFVPLGQRKRFVHIGAFTPGGGERYEIVDVRTPGFDNATAYGGAAVAMNDIAVVILDRPVPQAPVRRASTPAAVGDTVRLLGVTPQVSDARKLVQVETCAIDPAAGAGHQRDDEFCVANTAGPVQIDAGFSGAGLIRLTDSDEVELLGVCTRGAGGIPDLASPPVIVVDIVVAHAQFLADALRS